MKSFVVIFGLIAAVTAANYNKLSREWELYKAQYGKSYEDPSEDTYRMNIFAQSKNEIAQHNVKYLKGEVTYELGINQFADMLPEEIDKWYNGYNRPNRMNSRSNEEAYLPEIETDTFVPTGKPVPDYVNWVEKKAVTPVRSQGDCGACYAFAPVGSIESRYFIANQELHVLSVQQVVDCSSAYGNSGCDGGLSQYSLQYIIKEGITNETTYPYQKKQMRCQYKKDTAVLKITDFKKITSFNETDLKEAVAEGPVTVSLYASLPNFKYYKSGIFSDPNCDSKRLNHAVLAVGYGTDPVTKKDYWLIKNSWSTAWGEEGYLRLARNADNMCGVVTRPIFPAPVMKTWMGGAVVALNPFDGGLERPIHLLAREAHDFLRFFLESDTALTFPPARSFLRQAIASLRSAKKAAPARL